MRGKTAIVPNSEFCASAARPPAEAVFPRPDSEAIERFIAERGVVECPPNRGTRRAKQKPVVPAQRQRGKQPRRLGARYPGGRLKAEEPFRTDRGHEMTMLHRAEVVDPNGADKMREAIERRRYADLPTPEFSGLMRERAETQQHVVKTAASSLRAGDPKSTYVIGRMFLAGILTDPYDEKAAPRRHDAAYEYALAHFWVFGPATAPSHLRSIIAGMRLPPSPNVGGAPAGIETKLRNWETAAMLTPPCGRLLGIDVLRRAALYEMAPDNAADEATLRRVLDALARVRG